jgi:hypothetical protein
VNQLNTGDMTEVLWKEFVSTVLDIQTLMILVLTLYTPVMVVAQMRRPNAELD